MPLTRETRVMMLGIKQWTHTIWFPAEKKPSLSKSDHEELEGLIRASRQTESKMAITPAPFGGYDVVAVERILQSERIIYSGKCLPAIQTCDKNDAYISQEGQPDGIIISAKEYGNITHFFNHAFDANTLDEEIVFHSQEVRAQAATANFEKIHLSTSAGDFLVLRATRDINPGERVLWDYGIQYFDTFKITPVLFSNTAQETINPHLNYAALCNRFRT